MFSPNQLPRPAGPPASSTPLRDYLGGPHPGVDPGYVVLPRSLIESMSLPWQQQLTYLLAEFHQTAGALNWPIYRVIPSRYEKLVDLDEDQLAEVGCLVEIDTDGELVYRERNGRRIDNAAEATVLVSCRDPLLPQPPAPPRQQAPQDPGPRPTPPSGPPPVLPSGPVPGGFPGPQPGSFPDPRSGPPSGPFPGPHFGSHSGPQTGPQYGPQTGSNSGPHTGPQYGPQTGPHTGPQYGAPVGPRYGGPRFGSSSEPDYGPPSGPFAGPQPGTRPEEDEARDHWQ